MQILGGAVLALVCAVVIWRLHTPRRPYRTGPWPGLTVWGAAAILTHGLLLVSIGLVGDPLWPLSVVPVTLATWLTRVPGVASAVCGAYLLPRSLLSLAAGLELPPLLLAPAMAFDVLVWLRPEDLPRRRAVWRKRVRRPREVRGWRLAVATVAFEIVLVLAG